MLRAPKHRLIKCIQRGHRNLELPHQQPNIARHRQQRQHRRRVINDLPTRTGQIQRIYRRLHVLKLAIRRANRRRQVIKSLSRIEHLYHQRRQSPPSIGELADCNPKRQRNLVSAQPELRRSLLKRLNVIFRDAPQPDAKQLQEAEARFNVLVTRRDHSINLCTNTTEPRLQHPSLSARTLKRRHIDIRIERPQFINQSSEPIPILFLLLRQLGKQIRLFFQQPVRLLRRLIPYIQAKCLVRVVPDIPHPRQQIDNRLQVLRRVIRALQQLNECSLCLIPARHNLQLVQPLPFIHKQPKLLRRIAAPKQVREKVQPAVDNGKHPICDIKPNVPQRRQGPIELELRRLTHPIKRRLKIVGLLSQIAQNTIRLTSPITGQRQRETHSLLTTEETRERRNVVAKLTPQNLQRPRQSLLSNKPLKVLNLNPNLTKNVTRLLRRLENALQH